MRTTIVLKTVFVSLAACAWAAAGEGSLNGPVAAVVYDNAARSLHAVPGIPGSAYVDAALADGVDAAAFAPSGLLGLYVKEGGLWLTRQSAGGSWAASKLADLAAADLILWDAESTTAVVIAGQSATFWRADGARAGEVSGIAGRVVAAALDGTRLAAALMSDSGNGIWVYEAGSEGKLIARADKPVSVAIAGADLFFADRARNEIRSVRDYRNSGEPRLVASVDDPVGVAVSRNAVLFASASSRKAVAVRAGSGEPIFELALDFEPTGLERFGSSGWLLNAGQPGPLQVLVGGEEPAVYFIPRGQERNERAQ